MLCVRLVCGLKTIVTDAHFLLPVQRLDFRLALEIYDVDKQPHFVGTAIGAENASTLPAMMSAENTELFVAPETLFCALSIEIISHQN